MPAAYHRITVEQGASYALDVTYADAAGDPIDLTGYSGRGQIRLTAQTGTALASFTVQVTDAEAGEVTVTLPASALVGNAAITGTTHDDFTNAVYDIELYTAQDANVIRLLHGPCRISPEVTK
jgi:hypothetical protein